MALVKSTVALAVAVFIAALVLKLATAPLYAVYDAHDCRQAYARARTLGDTVRVDLHLLAGPGHVRHTCGEVRGRTVGSAVDISGLRR